MNKIRKALTVAALSLVAAVCLLTFKPVRAWASVQGDYIYHLFVLRGPAYVFKSPVGGAQGLKISTNTYAGAGQTGQPSLPTGDVPLWFIGGQTTAARTACSSAIEGQFMYDITVHSIAFCDGTGWHKLVTGSGANDSWTTY